MNIRKLTGVAFLGCAMYAGSSGAVVLTQSYTTSFTNNNLTNYDSSYYTSGNNYDYYASDSYNQYVYRNLPRFNLTGNLVDVDISFDTTWWHRSFGYARDYSSYDGYYWNGSDYVVYEDASINGQAYAYMNVQLFDPYQSNVATQDKNSVYCSDYDYTYYWQSGYQYPNAACSSVDYDDSNSFDGSLDLASFTVDDFKGTDALDFRLRNYASIYAYCDRDNQAYCSVYNDVYWSGAITVTYTYDVPEPSTLALLALGLVGVGATRKRKIH